MKYYLKLIILLLLSVLFVQSAFATQFVRLPLEKQIEEADFAVEATPLSVKIFKNLNGTIISDYTFSVNESYGANENEFHLEIVGGTVEGITTVIESSPRFVINQKVFLLLKKVESKIYLSNFTLGEYQIVKKGDSFFYQSEVFPQDKKIGLIAKVEMQKIMQKKWHGFSQNKKEENIEIEKNNKLVNFKISSEKTRIPSQIKNEKIEINSIVIIAIFIFFVGVFYSNHKKKNK